MQLTTCRNGHRYDPSLTSECPECAMMQNGTVALDGGTIDLVPEFIPETVPLSPVTGDLSKTVPLGGTEAEAPDEGRTVAVNYAGELIAKTEQMITGWLVCVDGPEKGKDYRIHKDNNYIGRNDRMDIRVVGDKSISSDKHALVTYDAVDRKFYFALASGGSIVRLNGRPVLMTQEIQRGDKLVIGQSTFLFIPLCDENFQWEE